MPNQENLKSFKPGEGPPPDVQSKAQAAKKLKKRMMPFVRKYQNMTAEEYAALLKDIKKNPGKHLMIEVRATEYFNKMSKSERIMVDYIDRNDGKAPNKNELSGPGGRPLGVVNASVDYQTAMEIYKELISGGD